MLAYTCLHSFAVPVHDFQVFLQAMVKDNKLNPMLLPASKLKKLLAAHDLHGSSGRCGFRVPNKRLW